MYSMSRSNMPLAKERQLQHPMRVAFLAAAIMTATTCGSSPTQADSATPALIAPASGAVMDNGCLDFSDPIIWEFDWTDVPGATEYALYVKRNGAQNPVVDLRGQAASSYQRVASSYITDFNLDEWEWRVRARVRGSFGEWSATRSFRVEPMDTDCQ
jgi:hypothetical protein